MKPLLMMLTTGVMTAGIAVGGYALIQQTRNSAVEIRSAAQPVMYTEVEEEIVLEAVEEEVVEEPEIEKVETESAPSAGGLSGTYRCWSFNMNGAGGRCTSPPIVFSSSGAYSTSSEQGTYTVNGSSVWMSASKIRGTGTLSADGVQLMFSYTYNGNPYTVTYLKQ